MPVPLPRWPTADELAAITCSPASNPRPRPSSRPARHVATTRCSRRRRARRDTSLLQPLVEASPDARAGADIAGDAVRLRRPAPPWQVARVSRPSRLRRRGRPRRADQPVDHRFPDGWALSTSAQALREILAAVPARRAGVLLASAGAPHPLTATALGLGAADRVRWPGAARRRPQTVTDALDYRGRFRGCRDRTKMSTGPGDR